jgi:hypothetical protein
MGIMVAPPLLSSEQHRALAQRLLDRAGEPGYPTKERAPQMARNHEVMAKMIDRRLAVHCAAPSLAPS